MRKARAWIHGAIAQNPTLPKTLVSRGRAAGALVILGALGFGGCAQQPQQLAAASGHSKEYFPSSVYGKASQRIVANGGVVPHGGGQYLVGKPYTIAGHSYYPSERKVVQVGTASWYGEAFHGRLTANGEIYDRESFTAAHPTMPLPSYARVTNLRTNASMIVRVNDRGPYASNRIMDVSSKVADALDIKRTGTAKVKVEYVGRASLAGSDDAKLYATLRTNGPAQWHEGEPNMVAEAQPPARVASIAPYAPAPVLVEPAREEVAIARHQDIAPAALEPLRERPIERPIVRPEPELRAEPKFRAEPRPIERPVRTAMREPERQPPHWQRGPTFDEAAIRSLVQREAIPAHAYHAVAEPAPPARPLGRLAPQTTRVAQTPLPPSRHMDLGTIPGAGVPIHGWHQGKPSLQAKPSLRLSRND
ncbi:septal ring lytic transglycosylase RlpA family protein [Beijerinckia sp. L45]|uniref:septal ring lytic transglycosylase RlpA family protein n=1 Tax=Beijerinckia sp. L45 TaxID=1641855 RepID=UPI001FF04495|nr:septal ring lytic transglycosylase RlpA family protein [Beijerinckia sp. L45]